MTDYSNPSPPAGTRPLTPHEVTPEMTAWAIEVDHDPAHVPMHGYALKDFGGKTYLAWVSWHTLQGATGRTGHFWGVSLFEVVDASKLPSQPAAQFVEGVDISHYSGEVDWFSLKEQGIAFAFLKATEGTGIVDASFASYLDGAHEQGILVGAYHFFRPGEDAEAQAVFFMSVVGPTALELPLVVDVEVRDGVAQHDVALRAEAFCDKVEYLCGRRPIVYTSLGFWPGDDPHESRLWVANWGVKSPTIPHGWTNWFFWQYQGDVEMPGVQGKADRDRFNGTLEDLKADAFS